MLIFKLGRSMAMTQELQMPTSSAEMRDKPVMIVDDMAEIRFIMAEVLHEAGFPTVTAGNGEEAWRLLAEGVVPRAILLDIAMPVMNGWQFLHAARPSVPVILMSGVALDLPPDCPAWVVATLEKPIGAAALLAAVRAAVDASRLDAPRFAPTGDETAVRSRR
jgi:CheY-like chemotaxis protein